MPVKVFLDSDSLLYLHDSRFPAKAAMATTWLRFLFARRIAVANLQVLNEISNVLFKKRKDLSTEAVCSIVDDFACLGASPLTWSEVISARDLRRATGYSWWDCLLLASAMELGCSHFLSEDLQDGQIISGLTILNPFLHSPEAVFGQEN